MPYTFLSFLAPSPQKCAIAEESDDSRNPEAAHAQPTALDLSPGTHDADAVKTIHDASRPTTFTVAIGKRFTASHDS